MILISEFRLKVILEETECYARKCMACGPPVNTCGDHKSRLQSGEWVEVFSEEVNIPAANYLEKCP